MANKMKKVFPYAAAVPQEEQEEVFDIKKKFINASEKGDLKLLKKCISKDTKDDLLEIYLRYNYYESAFRIACKNGHIDIVKHLVINCLKKGKINLSRSFHLKKRGFMEHDGFMLACENGHLKVVQFLESCFSIYEEEDDKILPFFGQYCVYFDGILWSCRRKEKQNFKVFKFLFEFIDFVSPLLRIYYGGNKFFWLSTNYFLLIACQSGNLQIVKHLVKKGANIYINNDELFRIAVSDRRKKVLKFLLNQIKDKSIRSEYKKKYKIINDFSILERLLFYFP